MSLAREQSTRSGGTLRAACLAMGVHFLASGCGMVIDTDRKQCETPSDCAASLGGAVIDYTCDQNLCNTRVECRSNEGCLAPGKNICVAGTCVECAVNADCGTASAVCVENICQDDVWGCVDEADIRPAPSGIATIKLQAVDPLASTTNTGVPSTKVKACISPVVDGTCASIFSMMYTYNDATGDTTIGGIPAGQLYRIRFDPPVESGMLGLDYLTNRTARDGDTTAQLVFTPAVVFSGLMLGGVTVDPKKSFAQIRAFNCLGQLAEGVTLTINNNSDPNLRIIYLEESMNPNPELTATTKKGTAGLLNGPTTLTRFSIIAGTKTVMTAQAILSGERGTVFDIFPRVFTQ